MTGETSLSAELVSGVGTIFDAGTTLVAVGPRGADSLVLRYDHDLSNARVDTPIFGVIPGRDCIATVDDRSRHTLFTTGANTVFANPIDDTMVSGGGSQGTYDTGNPITEHACADGPTSHVHVAWRQVDGSCLVSLVNMTGPPVTIAAPIGLPACDSLRMTLGALPVDEGMIVMRNGGQLGAQFLSVTGGPFLPIMPNGRSPRVSFDGTRYWVVWLVTTVGGDELHVGTLSPTGALSETALPFLPAGDEAYELVRSGSRVLLFVREREVLDVLKLCP